MLAFYGFYLGVHSGFHQAHFSSSLSRFWAPSSYRRRPLCCYCWASNPVIHRGETGPYHWLPKVASYANSSGDDIKQGDEEDANGNSDHSHACTTPCPQLNGLVKILNETWWLYESLLPRVCLAFLRRVNTDSVLCFMSGGRNSLRLITHSGFGGQWRSMNPHMYSMFITVHSHLLLRRDLRTGGWGGGPGWNPVY